MISEGIHNGTAEKDSSNLRAGKVLFAVKKAAGMPTRAAIKVDPRAILKVKNAVRNI